MDTLPQPSPSVGTPAQPPPSQYALYAALQTMKKRCLLLQQRLTSVEDENLVLRQRNASVTFTEPPGRGGRDRDQMLHDLQLQVGQLTLARQQATDRLQMIATENRQLWARLSQLTKTSGALPEAQTTAATDDVIHSPTTAAAHHQNLIRSKTFTQNAPNPALRIRMPDLGGEKLRPATPSSSDEISLEEISLKVLNEFLEKKAEAEKMCTEIAAETTAVTAGGVDSFGFGYLSDETNGRETAGDDEPANGTDLQLELKRCADGMADIRKEVLCQQSDIKVALSSLRQKRFLEVCPSCQHHLRHTATKSPGHHHHQHIERNVTADASGNIASTTPPSAGIETTPASAVQIDLVEQRRLADGLDKMCPMCAKMYTSATTFDAFQAHVESHFVDDSELDNSFDKNFELVSHTVGDF